MTRKSAGLVMDGIASSSSFKGPMAQEEKGSRDNGRQGSIADQMKYGSGAIPTP
jgi:hypothetical protein